MTLSSVVLQGTLLNIILNVLELFWSFGSNLLWILDGVLESQVENCLILWTDMSSLVGCIALFVEVGNQTNGRHKHLLPAATTLRL